MALDAYFLIWYFFAVFCKVLFVNFNSVIKIDLTFWLVLCKMKLDCQLNDMFTYIFIIHFFNVFVYYIDSILVYQGYSLLLWEEGRLIA